MTSFLCIHYAAPSNELVISAPKLSQLYNSTATFRVKFEEGDLVAQFQISRRLHVNETKWLILNLHSETSEKEGCSDDASVPTVSSAVTPTLRVKLLLTGPYRPEIASFISLTKSYFNTVDQCSSSLEPLAKVVVELPSKLPQAKYLLIPAVPISVTVVAALPIVLGLCVVGLPFFLPILVVAIVGAATIAASGVLLYFSTKDGRVKMSVCLQPILTTFLSTETGQKTIYDIGPRPSPQNLVKFVVPQDLIGKLITSLVLDLIGSSSYLLPVVGEGFDFAWAPIYFIILGALYDDVMPNLKYVGFLEEILPFTDVIPSATLGWVKEFGPGLIDHGAKQVHTWTVLARREGSALKNIRRQ